MLDMAYREKDTATSFAAKHITRSWKAIALLMSLECILLVANKKKQADFLDLKP